MSTTQKAIIILGCLAGAIVGNRLMLFAFVWDDFIESCCINIIAELATKKNYYGWFPLVGAVVGAFTTSVIITLIVRLKRKLKNN